MSFKNENYVKTLELGQAIKRRREELGLSLRDVSYRDGLAALPYVATFLIVLKFDICSLLKD